MVMSGMKMPSQLHITSSHSHYYGKGRAPASTGSFSDHSGGQTAVAANHWRRGVPVPRIELVRAVPAALGAGGSDAVLCRVPILHC
jgi:hypothetical protein